MLYNSPFSGVMHGVHPSGLNSEARFAKYADAWLIEVIPSLFQFGFAQVI